MSHPPILGLYILYYPPPSPPSQTGDYVDIVANSSIQKGMPYKFYHGRTGIVYNVSRRAVGVEVNKQVRNRIETKRVNVRIEHVKPSTCRIDFLNRVKANDEKKREAKKAGIRLPITDIKRFPVQPKAGYVLAAESTHGAWGEGRVQAARARAAAAVCVYLRGVGNSFLGRRGSPCCVGPIEWRYRGGSPPH